MPPHPDPGTEEKPFSQGGGAQDSSGGAGWSEVQGAVPPTPHNFMLVSCIVINLLLLIFMLILITLFPSPLAGGGSV